MSGFTHLHCHTDASLLDGVGRSLEYAQLAQQMGQTHLAITDHGHLYGLPEHRRACAKFGIKPLYGCELYVNDTRDQTKEISEQARREEISKDSLDPTFTNNHLVVLCENTQGWKNLLKLNHESVLNGYYYKPRTTHELICEHAEGLFATTACMGSQFGQLALRKDFKRLRALLGKFKDAFGDRFFYELHINEIHDQKVINEILMHECAKLKIAPLLTCDVHYACAGDVDRQDEMIAVARHTPLNDPKAFKLSARSLWFCGPKDMLGAAKKWGYSFPKDVWKNAVANTQLVASRCTADIYGDGSLKPPRYIDAKGNHPADSFEHLKQLTVAGFKKRFGHIKDAPGIMDRTQYIDRLKHELQVIKRCGMSDFYLVTMDVVDYCRSMGVFVWTRGSGCASLVAASLGITAIDPLRFNLLFERFVDPGRPNAPDFDLDIDAKRRGEVIAWLTKKYGGEKGERVARIVALSTFGLKSAVRDVCMAHGVPSDIAFTLSAAVDLLDKTGASPTIEKKLENCSVGDRDEVFKKAFKELYEKANKKCQQFMDARTDILNAAFTHIGRAIRIGRHAAGLVVAPSPLIEHLPVTKIRDPETKQNIVITAWGEGQASQDIAPAGLMKIDLLGLDTVTVVSECIAIASKRSGLDMTKEVNTLCMQWDEPDVLKEFASGNGFGLHQLNQADQSLAQFMRRLKPQRVDDVIAAIAMYRPGSLEFLDEYVSRAHGAEVESVHPVYDEILKDTYGIIVYQEQIMHILHKLAGIPLREAYTVIKGISKKDEDKVNAARESFIAGALKQSKIKRDEADRIFDLIEKFAGYGFNKAHAASYGVLSWLTAYLRAKHTLEFWLSWLNHTDNQAVAKGKRGSGDRKIVMIMRHAAQYGITLLPPAIGRSRGRWFISKSGALVAPLSLVMGVGEKAAELHFAEAQKHRWSDLTQFLQWAESNKKVLNRGALISLARAGAFAPFGISAEHAHDIVNTWSGFKANKKNGTQHTQLACALAFDKGAGNPDTMFVTIEDGETRMQFERSSLGFSFWNNPWSISGREEKVLKLIEGERIADDQTRRLRGKRRAYQVSAIRKHVDSKGKLMAFLTFQSITGLSVQGIVFGSTWPLVRNKVRVNGIYLVAGEFDPKGTYIVGGSKRPFIDVDAVKV